jgi:cytochrome c-type protein NapB
MSAVLPEPSSWTNAARKLAVVAAIVAFTTGLSGYFMARLQTDRSAARLREETRQLLEAAEAAHNTLAPDSAPLAPTYSEIGDRSRQPNHGWSSQLATLPPPSVFTAETPPLTREEITLLFNRRAARRAYNGAPPTVPHPIDQHQSTSCLACHGQPTRIGAVDVPQMSHAAYSQCIQCHAPANGPGSALTRPPAALATPVLDNQFAGLVPPNSGTRAYDGAPPTIPHTTAMRQNCLSCHGPGGSSVIKTSHPHQQSCLQCHATDAARETLPSRVGPPKPLAASAAIPGSESPR